MTATSQCNAPPRIGLSRQALASTAMGFARRPHGLAAFLAGVLTAGAALAQTSWTNPATGNWNTASNWSLGIPNAGSATAFDAVIENGGTAQLSTTGASVRRLRVGRAAGGGALDINGGGLTVTENFYLNENGSAVANTTVENGAVVTAPTTIVGYSSSNSGLANLVVTGVGSTYNATADLTVGLDGHASLGLFGGGALNIGGGTLPLHVATNAGSTGIVYLGDGIGAGTLQASAVQFGAGNGQLIFDHSGNLTFSTAISGGGTIFKEGPGVTTLSGTNSYAGGTYVEGGTLRVGAAGSVPTGGPLKLLAGTFDMNGFAVSVGSLAGAAGTVVQNSGTTLNVGSDNTSTTFAGNILGGSLVKTGNGVLTLSGLGNTANLITVGTGALAVGDVTTNGVGALGTGTLTLQGGGENGGGLLYTGPTGASSKNLTLASSSTIQVGTSGANLSLNGVVGESSPGQSLIVSGTFNGFNPPSTLTLDGPNTYTGGTEVIGGATLAIPTIANGGVPSPIGASSSDPSGLLISGGGLPTGLLLTGSNTTYSTDRGVTLNGSATIGVSNATTALTISGQIIGTPNASLVKNGAGTLILTNGANSYTGGTFVTAGTLKLGTAAADAIPIGGNVTVSNGATFDLGSPVFFSNVSRQPGIITLNGGILRADNGSGFIFYFANSLAMTGGTVDLSAVSGHTFLIALSNVVINPSATTAVWAANDPGAGMLGNAAPATITVAAGTTPGGIDLDDGIALAGTWAKGGPGVMRVTRAPTGANLAVTDGKLRVDDVAVLDGLTSSAVGNSLTLNGGTLQYAGPTAPTAANSMALDTGNGTVEVKNAAATLTFNDAITGLGSLTKSGPGTLAVTNTSNSFAGGVTVAAGRLEAPADAALGQGPVTVGPLGTVRYTATASTARTFALNSGVLEAPAGVALTLNGATVGGGFLRGPGTFALSGGTTLTGVTTFGTTTLSQTGLAALANFINGGTLTNAPDTTLTWNGGLNQSSGVFTINGTVNVSDWSSTGAITINGGGAVNNSGSNLVLGGGSRTKINPSGTLATTAGTTIELNGGLLVNNGAIAGTLNDNYGSLAKGTGAYGVVNVNGGGVFSPGNSPGIVTAAAVHFDNTPVASGAPVLQIELAGTVPGTQYDQLHVTGQLSLGGTLQVSLSNNFNPVLGNTFDVLDWGSRIGTFATLQLPSLTPTLVWDTSQLYTSGVLSVIGANFLLGDFNRDTHVDASDIPALLTALADVNTYKAAKGLSDTGLLVIGDIDGSGAVTNADLQALLTLLKNGGGSLAAVPEPASAVLLVLALPGLTFPVTRRRGNKLACDAKRC